MNQAGPAAVFWDMDGTLLDSEPIWDIAMSDFAVRHGIVMSPALREQTLGSALLDAMDVVYHAAEIALPDRDVSGDARWLLDHVGELFDVGLPWRPGAPEALDLLATASIPLVLVTNTVRELTEVALQTIGADRFVATVCGDEVSAGKPAPDPYLRAAAIVGQHPAACLAVEDSPTGAAAATAAGCPTLVVPSAAPVAPGALRRFRPTLAGLGLADFADAWTGQTTGHPDVQR
ncbi:HAD family phosphatase [Gordonia sp. ABSL1-1]|uniref:HAD family hydrolase n=1 Tax=Gordonia sp. ABSL1-1 TaxID=3053923 RepID=UPI002573DB3F|nr:HAD family phosphatase [Gordonia sp. ABSL1-1]MDL9935892.1 HAD family phosphatase [Gordonia sp. ABSL1-1]